MPHSGLAGQILDQGPQEERLSVSGAHFEMSYFCNCLLKYLSLYF